MATPTENWEGAWEEYLEALTAKDAAYPTRHKPRSRLAWKRVCKRARLAVEALRRLDPTFCESLGVE